MGGLDKIEGLCYTYYVSDFRELTQSRIANLERLTDIYALVEMSSTKDKDIFSLELSNGKVRFRVNDLESPVSYHLEEVTRLLVELEYLVSL